VSATNLRKGQIEYFYSDSRDYELTLDHILASSSLPPAFPMTAIGTEHYWDGGLFDNTPLGAVLDHLNDGPDVDRTVYVVNLFPNTAAIPKNMPEVAARMKNLQFANKSLEDVKLLKRFNEVTALAPEIQSTDCRDKMRARIPVSSGLFAINRGNLCLRKTAWWAREMSHVWLDQTLTHGAGRNGRFEA
jgi:NTE family protein